MPCHGCRREVDADLRICPHVAAGPLVTIEGPVEEAICTRCAASCGPVDLVPVCRQCHGFYLRNAIRPTPIDRARGYALAPRASFGVLRDRPWPHAPLVRPGDFAKLCFSILPTRAPKYLESMWVEVVSREGDGMTGRLDNDPSVFPPEVLRCGDPVAFDGRHVVEVRTPGLLQERAPDHLCGYCDPEARERKLDDGDRRLLGDVRKYGWHLVSIEDAAPQFLFSVGLWHTFRHPEVIALGLPPSTLGELVNRVGARARDGRRFEPGEESVEILEGSPCRFLPLADPSYAAYLGYGLWLYQESFPALQLVWPDLRGRWPGEDGFDPALAKLQPRLDSPT